MKSQCNREGMLAAIAMVGGVAPARSPKPILQNLKLVVDSTGSTLMATDLELGIRYMVSGVRVDEPGAVILPTPGMPWAESWWSLARIRFRWWVRMVAGWPR